MSTGPTEILYSRFSQFVASELGLHFPNSRKSDLERGLRGASSEFGFKTVESCMEWLMSTRLTKNQVEVLATHLTVGETYFFREKQVFRVLEREVLPTLFRDRTTEKRLRIWSAGCASGEEPYSVAISVSRTLRELNAWNVTILGTDINPRLLHKASEGIFTDWSFRDVPSKLKEGYFTALDERSWAVRSEIRKMVDFFHLNLADEGYPSILNNTNALDLIFCRNVLIYLTPEQANEVVRRLTNCLRSGGWLVFGPNDLLNLSPPGLVPVRSQGVTFYRKQELTSLANAASAGSLERGTARLSPPESEKTVEAISSISQNDTTARLVRPVQQEHGSSGLFQGALEFFKEGRYADTVCRLTSQTDAGLDAKSLSLLTRAHANQGNLGEALNWSDRLVEADKLRAEGHYLRGVILQEQGNVKEAGAALRRALFLDPKFVLAHLALGNLARTEGNFLEATRYHRNALELAEQYPPDELLSEAEGITAGQLRAMIAGIVAGETAK